MKTKSIYFAAMALLLAACGRQPGQSTALPASTGPGASTTAQAATLPPGSPAPVEKFAPPIQATPPPQTPPDGAAQESPIPTSAQPGAARNAAAGSAAEPQPPAPEVANSPAEARRSAHVTIPAGTRIRVRLSESLDTRNSRPGERFEAYLDEPVVSGDRVVVPKGTAFEGRVIEARRSGRLKGRAYLGVALYSFRLRGSTYMIATSPDIRAGNSHRKRNLAMIGGGSGAGAAIGAVAGGGVGALIGAGAGAAAGTTGAYIKGRTDVRLPAESTLIFSLRSAVAVRS